MTKDEIIEAYMFLREHNHSIPSETIEFMKDVALIELGKIKNGRECFSCRHDGLQMVFKSACTGCGADGELRNFSLKWSKIDPAQKQKDQVRETLKGRIKL